MDVELNIPISLIHKTGDCVGFWSNYQLNNLIDATFFDEGINAVMYKR